MKTYMAKKNEVERKWHVIDLNGQILGRAASQIVMILRGKHKPQFTPHEDTGDFVVVINASKVKVTGRKLENKLYYRFTGYQGGLRSVSLGKLLEKNPEKVIHEAVRRMLPKNKLSYQLIKKLKIYGGPEHPHHAQKPTDLKLSN